MKRRSFIKAAALTSVLPLASQAIQPKSASSWQLVIVGATPAGIMAAIAASRDGLKRILLLERTVHIGGLPANGLGATDIATRGGTGGLFLEFVNAIKQNYIDTYGLDSQQVKDCSDGYHFEPSVAELVLEKMLANTPTPITVIKNAQFEMCSLTSDGARITSITLLDRITNKLLTYSGDIFIDATYEGDLLAAAKVPFRLGREAKSEFNEPGAGVTYKLWGGPEIDGTTGDGDNAIQAYNYRVCLTEDPNDRVAIPKPASYNRAEYIDLIEDLHTGNFTGVEMLKVTPEMLADNKAKSMSGEEAKLPGLPRGLRRIVNMVKLPNGKTDSNNQHWAFISTDLPVENYPYPTATWAWRDAFANRLKDYILGFLWFAQNDDEVPQWYRNQIKDWGLSKSEYSDNEYFPRQVYVREGRRMLGKYFFTAKDALPKDNFDSRPPIHTNSITASHYALDSHACRKREVGRGALEGFISYQTKPYTVPAGVILPKKVKNLIVSVAVSGSHIGFSTLRMEPCWMALGQAAGVMASIAIQRVVPVQSLDRGSWLKQLQDKLLSQQAILIYVRDVPPSHPLFVPVQQLALAGCVKSFEFGLAQVTGERELQEWCKVLGKSVQISTIQSLIGKTRELALSAIWSYK